MFISKSDTPIVGFGIVVCKMSITISSDVFSRLSFMLKCSSVTGIYFKYLLENDVIDCVCTIVLKLKFFEGHPRSLHALSLQ